MRRSSSPPSLAREAGRPTIRDVAERAGVSKSLVSLVMRGAAHVSEERRNRVLAVAQEIGYRPNAVARSLVQRRTNLFGVLLSDLHNPFFAEVIDGLRAEAEARGYRVIISTGDRLPASEAQALESLLELRTDGLILASGAIDMDVVTAAANEIPTVLAARHARGTEVDSVANDDTEGATLAVEHLAALGHQRIAHIDGGGGAGARDRRRGYLRAMKRLGLEQYARVVPGSYTEQGGSEGAAALIEDGERPTAIFAANDLAAVGALGALAAVRRINLTTIDQPRPEIGRTAVSLLLERIEGRRDAVRHVLIPPSLVVRGTTASPAER
jgi:DNA-binding LacI/PurR family transcriptional regulator